MPGLPDDGLAGRLLPEGRPDERLSPEAGFAGLPLLEADPEGRSLPNGGFEDRPPREVFFEGFEIFPGDPGALSFLPCGFEFLSAGPLLLRSRG